MAADRTEDGTNKRMGVAADRHVLLLPSVSDAQVGQSSSPGPSQRVRKGSKYLCVVVLHQFFTRITSFPVKSFVDSANNGLDGVCIAFAPQPALN
jgi:hypothetical protein